jgi:hypothetical protein
LSLLDVKLSLLDVKLSLLDVKLSLLDVKFWKTLRYYIFHAILAVTTFNTVVTVPVN